MGGEGTAPCRTRQTERNAAVTSTDTTQATVETEPETVTVEVFIEETITYTGRLAIDPVDFLETTGVELVRATGAQIRDYAIDAEINHEELKENVAGQEWSDPTVYGMPDSRIAFEADGMRGSEMVEDVRVLVDPVLYEEATRGVLETAHAAEVLAYIENHPEECDFDGEQFVPVRICRAR